MRDARDGAGGRWARPPARAGTATVGRRGAAVGSRVSRRVGAPVVPSLPPSLRGAGAVGGRPTQGEQRHGGGVGSAPMPVVLAPSG